MKLSEHCEIHDLGLQDYQATWQSMLDFTLERDVHTPDHIWLVEHPPVFTLGQAGKIEHLLQPGDIPVVKTDRGGQVTYHGPGQVVLYALFDLRRMQCSVRQLVTALEQSMISLLQEYGIQAMANPCAPGVYVDGKKIGSIGLRVKKGCSYHGLSFNVDMDLSPFQRIHPCGYKDLAMTQLADLIDPPVDFNAVKHALTLKLAS